MTFDTSLDDPRERRQHSELRKVSKKVFGSQYRVEVADAIGSFESEWSTRDLEHRFPNRLELPWSCIAKEIKALLDLGFIERGHGKTQDGRKTYTKTDVFPSFWQLIQDIAVRFADPDEDNYPNNVRQLHMQSTKGGRS